MLNFHPSASRSWLFSCIGIIIVVIVALFLLPRIVKDLNPLIIIVPFTVIFALNAAGASALAKLTTYSLEESSISVVREGLARDSHSLPLKSIDNIRTRTSFLGRFLGITDVFVDTPGGTGYEMVLKDVPTKMAELLVSEFKKSKKKEE